MSLDLTKESAEARAHRLARAKAWEAQNKERLRQYRLAYDASHKDQIRELQQGLHVARCEAHKG